MAPRNSERNDEVLEHILENQKFSTRKNEEQDNRLNAHDIQIAVIQTKIVVYSGLAAFVGSGVVGVILKFWK